MTYTDIFEIIEVNGNRRRYLPLLLIGDESKPMIARYIDKGNLYVGMLGGVPIAVCAAVCIDDETVEVKNLAVAQKHRCKGLGRRMLSYVEDRHPDKAIILGTGETPSTLRFYKSCGYTYSHRIPDFFTDNYPRPIIEEGVELRDMVYLRKEKRSV